MHDFFYLYKKRYNHYYCSCYYYHKKKIRYIFPCNKHKEFCKKNIEYIKFFHLLQKDIKLNKSIYSISALIDIFMSLYANSNIDCNRKMKINYMIYITILFLINSILVIIIKIVISLVIIKEYK